MATNSPYTVGPNTIIHDDLKIFMGTYSEIKEIEDAKRVVNRKWYLAWDTGEIYIGNGMQKLIRFGGTANNLSKADIESIISSYTKEDLRIIKVQLKDALQKYQETNNNINTLRNDVNTAIDDLNNKTLEYIEKKIDEVLSTAESITYSKNQIDQMFLNNKNEIAENYVSNDSLSNTLLNYVSNDYANNNMLKYSSGAALLNYLANRTNGYYFCTSDSNDTDLTFERGHTYILTNGTYEDITAEGSGIATSNPSITLKLDGLTSSTLTVGDSFAKQVLVTYDIENQKYIRGNLIFYENKNPVKTDIPVNLKSFYYTTTLTDLTQGNYQYTLVGQDRNNQSVIGTYNLNVIAPIYYGSGSNIVPSGDTIKTFSSKLSTNVSGLYEITTKQNEYIWICIPSNLNITSFSLNGFTAPFIEPENIEITFGNVQQSYKAYRSYSSLQAGTIQLNIK